MKNESLQEMAQQALSALLEQKPYTMTRHRDEPRNYFPLPIKRQKPDANGNVTQDYRPIAVLEYVNEVLSGEVAAKQARERVQAARAEAEAEATA